MTAVLQALAALAVGWCYYMVAMFLTVYDGILSLILQPIAGLIYTSIAVLLVFLIGLPLRLIGALNSWWRRHWWLPFFFGATAFLMMVTSWLPMLQVTVTDPELGIEKKSFDPLLALGGYFLTLFSVLHFYPPRKLFEGQDE